MKLCDIYIGRLVRVITSVNNVVGAVNAVTHAPNKKGESTLIQIQHQFDIMGNKQYVTAYPSEIEPLTEEDM